MFEFVNKISKICPEKLKLVSFDVDSLFTKIPLLKTIIVELAFKNGAKSFHGFSKNRFSKAFKKIYARVSFSFM